MMILNLPLELQYKIFSYLSRAERVNLCLVCQELRETISVEDPWVIRSGELPKEVQRSRDSCLYPDGIFFYTRKNEITVIYPIELCVGDKPLTFINYGDTYYFHVRGIFARTSNDLINIKTGKTVLSNIDNRFMTLSNIPTNRNEITIKCYSETDNSIYFKVIDSEGIIKESPKYYLSQKEFKRHLYLGNIAMFLYNDSPGDINILIFKDDPPKPINIHINKFVENIVKLGSTPWCQYVIIDDALYTIRWEPGWCDVEKSEYRTLLVDCNLHHAMCIKDDNNSRQAFLLNLNNGEVFDIHPNIINRDKYSLLDYDRTIPSYCDSFKIYRNYLIQITPTNNTLTGRCHNMKTGSCRTLFEISISQSDMTCMYGTVINEELVILTRDSYVAVSVD